ncbi:MAG: radical SAM protein [Candidatus Colwellbacteria bacterium]|nr:radical SAM protein [Candidatus Colwellbacteria bacterium]
MEKTVFIQLNSTCNQHCLFCNRPPQSERSPEYLTFEQVIKKIDECADDPEIIRVCLTGGEPTLYPRLVEAVTRCHERGKHVEIQTNGVALTKERIKELKDAGIDIINFAFHSHKKEISNRLRGVDFGFENITESIKEANRLGIVIHIVHVITKLNYKDLPEFIDTFSDMGLDLPKMFLNLSIVVPDGWAWENKDVIVPRMSDIKPYLIEACHKCKEYGITFDISEVVPLCIVDGYEDMAISTVFKINNAVIVDDYHTGKKSLEFAAADESWAMKAPQCVKCSMNEICVGFYPHLSEMYGFEDYVPRTDDPAEIISRFKGPEDDRQ